MPAVSPSLIALVAAIRPADAVEAEHRRDALRWLRTTGDVYRRVPPATPPKHLVAYFLLRDRSDGSVFLGHHRKAGLWLPTGGHVEPGEDPADTVRREALEELGTPARFSDGPSALFVTVTETVGLPADRHTDVSLWYLLEGVRGDDLEPDAREFTAARWWTPLEVTAADPALLEPHLVRFLAKVESNGSVVSG